MPSRVLVIEDDPHVRFGVVVALRAAGHDVVEAESCAAGLARFRERPPSIVVTDLRLPDGTAMDLLPRLRALDPSVAVYIVTGYGSIDAAVTAVKEGAEDFLTKPVDMSRLVTLLKAAAERRSARLERERSGSRPAFRWSSPAMARLESQVERLRHADCSVLILGETGTGKTALARRIHEIGARTSGPFVDVNCAGLTRDFVESELFGHERGAFTGAHATKVGLFDAANGGTLFLDEIGDIDAHVQPKILKAVEDKRYRRMGDVRERTSDVRLVAATHHDLLAAISTKAFRADLYYRISTVTLVMPPLRERREDIPQLAAELLARSGAPPDLGLSPGARDKLVGHRWPGNIRELKNVLQRAQLHRRGHLIDADDLCFDCGPVEVPASERPPAWRAPPSSSHLLAVDASTATREEVEKEHIRLALEAENGRVEAAARRLGIPRSTLYWKLKNYGMQARSSGMLPRTGGTARKPGGAGEG